MIIALLLALAFTMNLFGKSVIIALMAVIGLLSAYSYTRHKLWRGQTVFNTGFLLVGLTAVAWFISAYSGLDADESIAKLSVLTLVCVLAYIITKSMVHADFNVVRFYKYTACMLIACSVIGGLCLLYYQGTDVKLSNLYGSILAMGTPFILYLGIQSHGKHALLWWLGLVVVCAAVFALGGRTGYVVMVVCAIGMMGLFPWPDMRTRLLSSFKIIAAMVVGCVAGLSSYYASVGDAVYTNRVAKINMDRPASGRLHIWENAFSHFNENPYFGVGIKGLRELTLIADDGNQVLHAHNIILELLIDTGLIGLALFTATVIWFTIQFVVAYINVKDKAVRAQYLPIFMGFVGYGVACMALTSIFHTWWFLYLTMFIILMVVGTKQMRQSV